MTTIKEVRAAAAATLQSTTLRAYARATDNPELPCVVCYPRQIPGPASYEGAQTLGLTLEVLTPSASEEGQDLLDDLLDLSGIPATIDADRTLGGVVQDAFVTGMDPNSYGTVTLGNDTNRRAYRARLYLEVFV